MRGNIERYQDVFVYQAPTVASSRRESVFTHIPKEIEAGPVRQAAWGLKGKREEPAVKALPMKREHTKMPRLQGSTMGFKGDVYEKGEFLKRIGLVLKHAVVEKAGTLGVVVGATVFVVGGVTLSLPVALTGAGIVATGAILRWTGKHFWAKNDGARTFASRFESK